MSLLSSYLGVDPLLVSCADGTSTLAAGASGGAVERIQRALFSLGYGLGVSGLFDDDTAAAVVAFKTAEGLEPSDPVVGPKTMATLDIYLYDVPADPDLPDPSSDGVGELFAQTVSEFALPWVASAIAELNRWPADEAHPGDPDWDRLHECLERNFHLASVTGSLTDALEDIVLPVFRAVNRCLDAVQPFLVTMFLEQGGVRASSSAGHYTPVLGLPGGVLVVSPAFRNALNVEGRAAVLIRAAVHASYREATGRWDPATARYRQLSGDDAIRNVPSYARFAYEIATGGQTTFTNPFVF